ncbi:hypothetical protein EBU91_03005 [bacterium]|nr:hypothetical protein [bacterium]
MLIIVKKCPKCKEHKILDSFYKSKTHLFERTSICKICWNKSGKKYVQKNKTKVKEYKKEYYQKNKQKIKEKYEERLVSNKEKILENKRKYYHNNKKILKKKIKYYRQNNKEKRNAHERNRRKIDIVYRIKLNYRSRISGIINGIGRKSKKTEEMLGCSWETFVKYLEQNFKKGMNWNNYGDWHIDHVIPLCTAKTVDELNKLTHYTNCQPLWAEENLKKGAKI